MNAADVFPKVREIVADVLVIDKEDVSITSRLINDLGAESIDFLDLVFQLEKEFKINSVEAWNDSKVVSRKEVFNLIDRAVAKLTK